MTDTKHQSQERAGDAAEFTKNMATAIEKCQRIWQEFLARQPTDITRVPFDPLNLGTAFRDLFTRLMSDPMGLWGKQVMLWQDYANLWQSTTQRLLGEEEKPIIEPDSKDRRFKDTAWKESPVFDFVKQSYLLTARWLHHTVQEASDELDPHTARKLDFYTRQFVDAMSPSNFLMTNPEVLKATLESNGENLVKGLTNLLEDIERGNGKLRISMTDFNAFAIGKNLAMTKGKVVFQNDLIQLIQYEATTKDVYKTPLLVVPAWINKFYILDLQQENSFVKWLVDQGHTVFIVSWVNPDERLSRKSFDDYMIEGPLAALDAIEALTGETEVSMIGYCLGGTLQAITLAWLTEKKQVHRIRSATYLTTMIDFSEAGELSVFIDEEQLQMLESRMSESGYLEGSEMSMTFNMLRANDLIWSFVVNNYLLGKDPFPFDLLYWNADSTRMPAAMHSFYLRNMYQKNLLMQPGKIRIAGVPIDLRTIKTPSYILSTREDHIAPWKSTYAATQIYGGDIRFVLAASGHIAGVVNPPAKKKYSHWIDDKAEKTASHKLPVQPDKWFAEATEHAGSWWPNWHQWQLQFAGSKIPARTIKKAIEDAPGTYVKVIV
ncbi:MAG: class I poly(R)-hydroxyalkanoic acid synthase [Rickettsiales bacterium]|nr:class I poly(R)-hydroxyalkanoic acid synthase [Rickettsiales bacterium]